MLPETINDYRIILASGSPRRQELLKNLGLKFEIQVTDVDETYPEGLQRSEIALYLSQLKANAFDDALMCGNCLVIAADTIVWLDDRVLPKPSGRMEAIAILNQLSGRAHNVITGVTLRSPKKTFSFFADTRVFFKELTLDEINYYVDAFHPYDKAGAYGIQEWIGSIGIERIEGCYFNVVGLPVQLLYTQLIDFLQ
jgi:septum formation protein